MKTFKKYIEERQFKEIQDPTRTSSSLNKAYERGIARTSDAAIATPQQAAASIGMNIDKTLDMVKNPSQKRQTLLQTIQANREKMANVNKPQPDPNAKPNPNPNTVPQIGGSPVG